MIPLQMTYLLSSICRPRNLRKNPKTASSGRSRIKRVIECDYAMRKSDVEKQDGLLMRRYRQFRDILRHLTKAGNDISSYMLQKLHHA